MESQEKHKTDYVAAGRGRKPQRLLFCTILTQESLDYHSTFKFSDMSAYTMQILGCDFQV